MRVEMEKLDATTAPSLSQMLVFPMPVDAIYFRRLDNGWYELEFELTMNSNEATTTVVFHEGEPIWVAALLDQLPFPVFIDGTAFMLTWEIGGFSFEANGPFGRTFELDFPNPANVPA